MKKQSIIYAVIAAIVLVVVLLSITSMLNNKLATKESNSGQKIIYVYIDIASSVQSKEKYLKIAEVSLDEKYNFVVDVIIKDNENIQRLSSALKEIGARETLSLASEDEEMINGIKSLVMKVVDVEKNNPNYLYAAKDILINEYGIRAEVKNKSTK